MKSDKKQVRFLNKRGKYWLKKIHHIEINHTFAPKYENSY